MSEPTVPCDVCGTPTTFLGTRRCNNCWEVESRLAQYLKSPAGQTYARNLMPLLDDWVDGEPDAWDYEKVLAENEVKVLLHDDSWYLCWHHGSMGLGATSRTIARKASALFVCLWLRGVSASFADKLMDGFIVYLERQEKATKNLATMLFEGLGGFLTGQ